MRVTKDQIINGVVSYMENDVIPQISDRAQQIIFSVAVKTVKANTKVLDSLFESQMIKAVLNADSDGTYEIDGLFESISESIKQYGAFPVEIPPIPLISPTESTFRFSESDVADLKRQIERSK